MPGLSINTPWVKYSKPRPQAHFRLFCFPHAGKGASLFSRWSDELPDEIEVCAVQLPGREDRISELPFTHMPLLIRSLAYALYPHFQTKPYAFFGHSMGGTVCFELARHLQKHHYPGPAQLFIAAQQAPQLVNSDPPTHNLPDKEFIGELRRLNGTPIEILQNAEVLEIALPLLRADFAICETYQYIVEDPLTSPIFVAAGLDDNDISYDKLTAWREQTQASFTLRMFAGDHFFLENSRKALLQAISHRVDAVLGT